MPGLTHNGSLSGPLNTQWPLERTPSWTQLSHRQTRRSSTRRSFACPARSP